MRAVGTSPHSSDDHYDNSGPSLLAPILVTGKRAIVTGLPVVTGYLISVVHCY
jgi:hypothetical protein